MDRRLAVRARIRVEGGGLRVLEGGAVCLAARSKVVGGWLRVASADEGGPDILNVLRELQSSVGIERCQVSADVVASEDDLRAQKMSVSSRLLISRKTVYALTGTGTGQLEQEWNKNVRDVREWL